VLRVPHVLLVRAGGGFGAVDEVVPRVELPRKGADEDREEQHGERGDRQRDVLECAPQSDRPAGVRHVVDQHPEERAECDVEGEDVAEEVRVVELPRGGDPADDEHQGRDSDRDPCRAHCPVGRRAERRGRVRQPVRVGQGRGVVGCRGRGAHVPHLPGLCANWRTRT
jgi:hypothetical protein